MEQVIKSSNLFVVTPYSGKDEPEQHSYVVKVGFPASGGLLIVYKDGACHAYAPGTWLTFHTETIK